MLLGRAREREELERVLATARAGHSAVLGLLGEPGIGKTALLDDAAANAEGFCVLRARGVESEARVPFASLFALLRPALHLLGQIPAPQADALGRALALRPGAGGERFAVGAATLSLLAAQAEDGPVLVLVDDAHLLDPSSAEALRFALRRLLAEPIAAVIAVRDHEPSLLDDADLPTLPVAGLELDAAVELLAPVSQEVVAHLHRATAGNPLALLELGASGRTPVAVGFDAPLPAPASVSRAYLQRAEALTGAVRRLLVLVAASGATELPVLERAAASLGLGLDGIDTADAAGLLRVHDGLVELRHPLARAALYGAASPDDRRAAHRALAAVLPDRDLDRRAWHLAAAAVGTDRAAAAALEQAGIRARERSAYAVAAAAFERAARLCADDDRRAQLLFAGADAAWLAGSAEQAVALLSEARRLCADGEQLIRIEHLRGHIAARRGPVMDGYAILSDAAERAAGTDPDLAVRLLAEAIDACFFAGAAREMSQAAGRVRELLSDGASAPTRFLAATAEGMALVLAGGGPRGIAALRRGVAMAEVTDELWEDPRLLPWLAIGPLWLREGDAGRALVASAIQAARARAALGVLPWLLNRVARDHAAADAWEAAEVEYDEAIRLARETGQRTELAAGLAGLAWLEARQGREPGCRAYAAEALELCAELGVGLYETWALRALGELELGLGRPAEALVHLQRLDEQLIRQGIGDVDVSPAAELVDVHLRLGDREAAVACAERHEREAQAKGQPWSLARAARCRGLLADDAFEPHFEAALTLHRQTPDAFELACTHLAYGARLRRGRRRVRAREQLRAALEIFDRLGAEPWSERARGELEATGETARRRDVAARDALTPQELQIAQLLADGRTTREAAAALFLSPKTIEYHLGRVYRKLGVNSRDALAQALSRRDGAG